MDKFKTCDKGHKLTCQSCFKNSKNKKLCNYCNKTIINTMSYGYCSIECKFNDSYILLSNGCHAWKNKNNTDSIPLFSWQRKIISARNFSLLNAKIELKKGMFAKTICGLHHCVNPDHLTQKKRESAIHIKRNKKSSLTDNNKSDIFDKYFNNNWSIIEISNFYKIGRGIVYRFIKDINNANHLITKTKTNEVSSDEDAQKELERIQKELGS